MYIKLWIFKVYWTANSTYNNLWFGNLTLTKLQMRKQRFIERIIDITLRDK